MYMNFVIMNKVMVLLRKGFYPYEYMDEWNKFDEK